MKYILLAFLAINFNLLASSCGEYSLTSLHRMSGDDYCSESDVIEAAYAAYGASEGDEVKVHTPRREDVYGDNDGSSLLVLKRQDGKSKYVRFKVEYGSCRILSCSNSGFYKDEI